MIGPRPFPLEDFLSTFDEFNTADVNKATVQSCGLRAMHYIKREAGGMPLPEDEGDRQYALFLMTAHMIQLRLNQQADGDGTPSGSAMTSAAGSVGRIKKAMIGSVTVETDSPNGYTATDWTYWLSQTEYGLELLAFLEICGAAGIFLNKRRDSVRVLT